ncbi:hypothetical protein Tco_0788376 [Tanacetum coccineum]
MKSSIPTILADTLKEQLPSLLSDALKDTLSQLIKDSIKSSVSTSIVEELPQVEVQVQKNLHDQLPNILLNPMYKEFNAFNKLESQRFVLLQKELSKSLHNTVRKSISLKDMVSLLKAVEVFKKANVEGEKWEKNNPESTAKEKDAQHPDQSKGEQDSGATTVAIIPREQALAQVVPNIGQAPSINEEKAHVFYTSEEKSLEEDTSGKKETDNEPPTKKLKFLISSSSIPSPTPLKSIMVEPPKVTKASKMTLDQFTKHLSKTTSSIFSLTPPREPNLPKEPTPPRDFAQGKEVAITKEQVNKLVSYQEERGSNPKMPKTKSFTTSVGPLSQEEFTA